MYNDAIFDELVRRMECEIEKADNNECQLFTGYKKGITILIKIPFMIKIKRMLQLTHTPFSGIILRPDWSKHFQSKQ